MLASHSRKEIRVAQNNSGATVVAALIIGASIVAGSFLVRSSVDRAVAGIGELKTAIEVAATTPPSRARDLARPERLDPNRRYSVNTQGAPVRGDPDAKLAVIEFSDFQCPYCSRALPTLDQIQREYGDKVRIVFKHLPLTMHAKAPAAHAAAEAAHRQGKFWEMHNKIFADQAAMSPEKYQQYARELGLDVAKFERDTADASVKRRIDADAAEAQRLGVTGTPAFFVNGRFVSGAVPFDVFKNLLDEELGKKG
jgi:protein-disulfide isomerase